MANYRIIISKNDELAHDDLWNMIKKTPSVFDPRFVETGKWTTIPASDVMASLGPVKDPVTAVKLQLIRECRSLGFKVANGDIEVESDGNGGVKYKLNNRPTKLSTKDKVLLAANSKKAAKHEDESDHLSHKQEPNLASKKAHENEQLQTAADLKELISKWDDALGAYNTYQSNPRYSKEQKAEFKKRVQARQKKLLTQIRIASPKMAAKLEGTVIV